MTRSAAALLQALMLSGSFAQAADFQAVAHEEWSGTYRCGPPLKDPAERSGFTAQVKLVLKNGVATIARESVRIKETMTGNVAADGRVTLEGGGIAKHQGGDVRWRYRFEGQFDGGKFEARGAMLAASGTKVRDCTMTLTRVAARGGKAVQPVAGSDAQEVPVPPPPVPAAVTPPPAAAPDAVAVVPESPPAATVEPAKSADVAVAPGTSREQQQEPGKYSRGDRTLLALLLGLAVAGAGLLLYDWRRPQWLTPRNAIAALVAGAVGAAGIAFYALAHAPESQGRAIESVSSSEK